MHTTVDRGARAERLDLVLQALASRDPSAHPGLNDTVACEVGSFDSALAALVALWAGDGERGAAAAHATLRDAPAGDVQSVALARAVAGFAMAQTPSDNAQDPLGAALRDLSPALDEVDVAIGVLLVEAALACARLDLARTFAERVPMPETLFGRIDHPFLPVVWCTYGRVHLFRGDIGRAQPIIERAVAAATTTVPSAFALACAALVAAVADQRSAAREAVRRLDASDVVPSHLLASGVFMIAAYAAISQNDVDAAARILLHGSARADLSDLRIVDRVLGIEILVRAAVDSCDTDVGRAWWGQVAELGDNPIAKSTVVRIESRLLLAEGDANGALAAAERAIRFAHDEGRAVEAAESEILAARAKVVLGEAGAAARHLSTLAAEASDRGYHAVRLAAARELRGTGRRLLPARSSGWEGLSIREREVAGMLAAGSSNGAISASLNLSPHTVRMHVSRVLHAYGTPTRASLAAMMAAQHPPGERQQLSPLTPRQQDVADRIAAGASNATIAADLGVGVFTVEKHVTAILSRWGLSSRAGIAAAVAVGASGDAP